MTRYATVFEQAPEVNHKDTVIAEYLSGLDEGDSELADIIAEQLYDPAKPLADTVVIIPVAAAAEAPVIAHAIHEYARQETTRPFSIVLGYNIDYDLNDQDDPAVLACLANAAEAQAAHPDLDVRSSFMPYAEPKIGAIRRNIWNGVLRARQMQSDISPTKEIVGLNHDIDLIKLPRYYIAQVQRHYENGLRSIAPAYTRSRHAFDPDHPNISRLTIWNDFMLDQRSIGYEAAAVIPMSFYASHGGFDSSSRLSEVLDLVGDEYHRKLLRTGFLQTSPRRMVARLPTHGFEEIWTKASFTSNDACRQPELLRAMPDLSAESLVSQLQARASFDVATRIPHIVGALANRVTFDFLAENAETIPRSGAVREKLAQRVERQYGHFEHLSHFVLRACTPQGFDTPMIEVEQLRRTLAEEIENYTDSMIINLQLHGSK